MNRRSVRLCLLLTPAALMLLNCESDSGDNHSFFYNSKTGTCQNTEGTIGFNVFDILRIRSSKNAECVDLSGQTLVYLLDTAKIESFNELGYNILDGYNFRGSRFDTAILFFNNIYRADFAGADLRGLRYGYAIVKGEVDEFTLLPLEGSCTIENDSLRCVQ